MAPAAVIRITSFPAARTEMFQYAVALCPATRVPMLNVGTATVKNPFWEARVAVMPDITSFTEVLPVTSMTIAIGRTWLSLMAVGMVFPGSPSRISRYIYRPSLWQPEQGLVDIEPVYGQRGAAARRAATTTSTSRYLSCMGYRFSSLY